MTGRRRGRWAFCTSMVVLLALLVCSSSAGFAQSIQPSALREIEAILAEKSSRTSIQQKLDSHLHLSGQAARGAVTSSMIRSLPNIVSSVPSDDVGNVHVDIHGTVTPGLLAEIVALGGTVESSFPNYDTIRAWIPLLAAETLASRSDVTFITPAARGMGNTRPINTKSLISHGADVVLNQGTTGSGVKVGVMSDGLKSLSALQAAGNLPSVTVLSGQAGPVDGDEGTAMLEIVYDLAPGAQLLYATASTGAAQFATNIQNLAAAGAKIIVDDFTYFNEGVFQDDIIARAVNTVTANGVLYLSSAGNSGNLDSGTSGTWEGDFVDSGTSIPVINSAESKTVKVHAFDATHNFNQITVAAPCAAGGSPCNPTTLKWSDPLGASNNDYDLFILDSTMSTILAFSNNFQTGTQNPFESVSTAPLNSRIVVVLFSGSPRALNVVTNRGRLAIGTSGATFGHNAAGSALTVAATPAQNSIFTAGNQSPETYSSDGPRKIFFNPNGSAITPGNILFATGGGTTLSKVDFTAADCGQSAVSGFNPFCGTSAAAPAAAAIAALIMSAQPSLNASQVAAVLKSKTIAAHAGFGARTVGSGIVMASGTTPIEAFVTRLYQQVLARSPDPAGLAAWVSFLQSHCSPAGVNTVADAFFDSAEFRTARPLTLNGLVTVLYGTFLDRAPEPAGLAGWAAAFRAQRVSIAVTNFIPSAEFQSLVPDRSNANAVRTVVMRLYAEVLGRTAAPAEVNSWVNYIVASHDLEGAATAFLISPEFENRALTFQGYIRTLYRAFLGREPDPGGLAAFEAILRAHLLFIIHSGFTPSAEFQGVIAQLCSH